jgi:hypothetical protein
MLNNLSENPGIVFEDMVIYIFPVLSISVWESVSILEIGNTINSMDRSVVVSEITNSHQRRRKEKDDLEDMMKFSIPIEIKDEARRIYSQIKMSTRQGRRKQLLFFIIYEAYMSLNIVVDYVYVAEIVGIPISDAKEAFNDFSEARSGYKSPLRDIQASDLIPNIARITVGDGMVEECVRQAEEIIKKIPALKGRFPRDVAIVVVYYIMEINGMDVDRDLYIKRMQISTPTFNSIRTILLSS